MKKYYIVNLGEVVSTAKYFGKFEDLSDAKEKAFAEMAEGEVLAEYNEDDDPLYTDTYGYETVDLDKALDRAELCQTDDSMEDIPAGLWYWSDDNQDTTFYEADGTIWD